jgi:hypothetical protein
MRMDQLQRRLARLWISYRAMIWKWRPLPRLPHRAWSIPKANDNLPDVVPALETFPVPTLEDLELDLGQETGDSRPEQKGDPGEGDTSSVFNPQSIPPRRSERLRDNSKASKFIEHPPLKTRAPSRNGDNGVRAPKPAEFAITGVLDRKTVNGHV